jgi:hypothetical protein
MFKIWFNDGSSVAATAGGNNYFDKDELHTLAERYDFDAAELLRTGETLMLDDQGETIGGVIEVYGLEN